MAWRAWGTQVAAMKRRDELKKQAQAKVRSVVFQWQRKTQGIALSRWVRRIHRLGAAKSLFTRNAHAIHSIARSWRFKVSLLAALCAVSGSIETDTLHRARLSRNLSRTDRGVGVAALDGL